MTINLITFQSDLDKQISLRGSHARIINELEKNFTINMVLSENIHKLTEADFKIIFIASGGVERAVMQHFEQLPYPFIMLADGMQNSLASALEVSFWLRTKGIKSEILHGEIETITRRIRTLYTSFKARLSISGQRIGVIGSAPWLIASNVDYLLAKRRWGIEYTDISTKHLYEVYDRITDDEVGQSCADLAEKASACLEATPEDLLNSMRFYHALRLICKEEGLNAVTLNCFKLMEQKGVSACLALSLLNDEGIAAGCEGDLQSIFTLLVAKVLTGAPGFMASPFTIDRSTGKIILMHCTIPTKMTESFSFRSHYETGKGISIQGIVPAGNVTILKCGGECLDEYYLTTATLIENTNYTNACRTQLRVKLHTPADYFFKNPLGNHHIMILQDYEDLFNEFFSANACKSATSTASPPSPLQRRGG